MTVDLLLFPEACISLDSGCQPSLLPTSCHLLTFIPCIVPPTCKHITCKAVFISRSSQESRRKLSKGAILQSLENVTALSFTLICHRWLVLCLSDVHNTVIWQCALSCENYFIYYLMISLLNCYLTSSWFVISCFHSCRTECCSNSYTCKYSLFQRFLSRGLTPRFYLLIIGEK